MNKPASLLSLIIGLVALAVFGFLGAKYMLSSHTETTMERLSLVWPGIATMPEQERGFLVELAHTCSVTVREPVRSEVIDCLRSVPMDQTAKTRLERLLGPAPQASSAR